MTDHLNKWCLCRWLEGNTTAILRARGEKNIAGFDDPETGAAFCGPLAFDLAGWDPGMPSHLQGLAFPKGEIGNVALFDTREAAAEMATWDGVDKVAIDLPAPVAGLHFSVEHYRYWDGCSVTVYDGGDLRQARAERLLLIDELGAEAIRHKVRLICRPLWERMRIYCPTPEQAAALNATDECNRADFEQMRKTEQ